MSARLRAFKECGMGFLSWLSATGKKSAAAAALETYFGICKRHGAFSGDPHRFANQAVEQACDKLPSLTEGSPKPYLLAAACLTVLLVDEPTQSDHARLYAMGTSAMLQALYSTPGFIPTPSEARIIDAATAVMQRWADTPSPWLAGLNLGADPVPEVPPRAVTGPRPGDELLRPLTARDQERARAELVRRMRELDGKS
jgi:hypothetical protein